MATTATTGPMKRIAAFRPGTWDGRPVTAEHLRAMVQNFRDLSTGPRPYYRPFLSINHEDGLACGTITGADLDAAATLFLDAANVPGEVLAWAKSDRLQAPSIEFWDPGLFRMPDGSMNRSPVLKCLTLCGNMAPAVKGLPPLSAARFTDYTAARKFTPTPETTMTTATLPVPRGLAARVHRYADGSTAVEVGPAPSPGDGRHGVLASLSERGIHLPAGLSPESVAAIVEVLANDPATEADMAEVKEVVERDAAARGGSAEIMAAAFADRGGTRPLTPHLRQQMLGATGVGRAVLEAEAKGTAPRKFTDAAGHLPPWKVSMLRATSTGRAVLAGMGLK